MKKLTAETESILKNKPWNSLPDRKNLPNNSKKIETQSDSKPSSIKRIARLMRSPSS